jgi:hypothetical protein
MKTSILRRLERLESSARPDPSVEAARARDPVQLILDLNMTPDNWQARVLRSKSDRLLILAARQTGKSTVCAALALWTMLHRPGSLVLIAAPVGRQSNEAFLKVLTFYRRLGRPVPPVRELQTTLELVNGSRCVCVPGVPASVRCFSEVSLCVIDESAQVDDDQLFVSLMPMLAVSKGRFICATTPFGRRGWFWERWEDGDPTWERHRSTAVDCPRIDRAFLAEQRRVLGVRWFDQEYNAIFVETVGQVLPGDQIDRAFLNTEGLPILAGF